MKSLRLAVCGLLLAASAFAAGVSIPPIQDRHRALANGLEVYSAEDHATPTVSIQDVKTAAMPARRLTDIGGEFAAWSSDGRKVHWSLGSSFFIFRIPAFVEGIVHALLEQRIAFAGHEQIDSRFSLGNFCFELLQGYGPEPLLAAFTWGVRHHVIGAEYVRTQLARRPAGQAAGQ